MSACAYSRSLLGPWYRLWCREQATRPVRKKSDCGERSTGRGSSCGSRRIAAAGVVTGHDCRPDEFPISPPILEIGRLGLLGLGNSNPKLEETSNNRGHTIRPACVLNLGTSTPLDRAQFQHVICVYCVWEKLPANNVITGAVVR